MNAVLINLKDNVAVVTAPVAAGETVQLMAGGKTETLTARCDIPIYHKIARFAIRRGETVIKYGETIGLAAEDFAPGDWLNEFNIVHELV